MKKLLYIKNTFFCVTLCVLLTFISSVLIMGGGHYHEINLSNNGVCIISIIVILLYGLFYFNLARNVFDKQRQRDTTVKILLIIYFIFQTLFSLIVLSLLFIITGFWDSI